MKYMNNHYGESRIFKKASLQLFAEDDTEDEEEDPDDDPEDGEDEEEENEKADKKGKGDGRLYTKKELGAIVAREVQKVLKEKKPSQSEAEKLENMTEEQRKHKSDSELEELKRKVARMELSKVASKALKAADIDVTDEILDFVVGDDAESTNEKIEKFIEVKNGIVKSTEKERSKGKTPKVATNEGKQLTREELAKMSYKDVLAYKTKNPEGYKKAMEE